MPLVSIITPVDFRAGDHLAAAYDSVVEQVLPAGWEWEWLVHVDGGVAPEWLLAVQDDRVRSSMNDQKRGPAAVRNMLLARSQGSHVKVLDADDQLALGAVARDLTVIDEFPRVTWVTSRARDLREDGTFADVANPPPGLIGQGDVFHYWKAHNFLLPVHPATLFAKRGAVVALGGWTSVPTSEDTGLLLALNCCEQGYFIDECGLIYRKWAKQLTAQAHHLSERHLLMRCSLIAQRCELLLQSVSVPG
ncbi:MAG: glycosyltransferase [Ilumatobacteraceae bacterium]